MKSLRQTRKAQGLSIMDVARQLGINNVQLHDMECGKHSPGELIRRQLELFYGERINWLASTRISYEPKVPASSWNEAEREFRYHLHQIASLTDVEKKVFIRSMIEHLNKLIK